MANAAKAPGGPENPRAVILTIGHSTHPADEFIEILRQHGVEQLIDIRTIPRSRRNPQFNTDELAKSLRKSGISYVHMKDLGGLRHPRPDSRNTGWRNASFRGYADYMQTDQFQQAIRRLLEISAGKRTVVMCAEAVPWRCHRSLLADALLAQGVAVEHILGARRQAHHPTPFAHIERGRVTYPGGKGKPGRTTEGRQPSLRFEDQKGEGIHRAGEPMPGKKRKPKFTAAKEARRRARLLAGTPPAQRVVPDKRRKPSRHKQTLDDLARELD